MKSIDGFAYQDSRVLSLSEGSDNTLFMVDGEKLGRWSVMVDTMLSDMEKCNIFTVISCMLFLIFLKCRLNR